MQRVWIASDPTEAHLVAEALRANGIAATVHSVPPGVARDREQPHPAGPAVWVADADFERACALVRHVDTRRLVPRPPRCEGCGDLA